MTSIDGLKPQTGGPSSRRQDASAPRQGQMPTTRSEKHEAGPDAIASFGLFDLIACCAGQAFGEPFDISCGHVLRHNERQRRAIQSVQY
jgi:hypothetical protein